MRFQEPVRAALAISYLLLISILFFLPGSAFPKAGWLEQIHFDKLVHIGLFALLALAWCWTVSLSTLKSCRILFSLVAFYGILVEIIQGLWIPNRSFDWVDWMVDMIGDYAGIVFWRWRVRAKK